MSTDGSAQPATSHPSTATDAGDVETVLALDCGQSGTRARVVRGGQVLVDGIALAAVRTDHSVITQLAEFTAPLCDEHHPDAVALGVSGLTDADTADQLLAHLAPHGVQRVALAHDSVTSFLAALGAERGVVTAAGTGVVTMAVGAERSVRVDGWGYIMGDAGSGWWIGRAGLDAGMRAFDGRQAYGRASEGMLAVIRDDFGDPAAAYMQLQADPDRVQRVASYARVVLDLADSGDAACAMIADAAALELAISASTGLEQVGETNDPQCAVLGGIFGSRLLREDFQRHLVELLPGARLVTPHGVGLDGAVELAMLPEDHAMRQSFTEAHA